MFKLFVCFSLLAGLVLEVHAIPRPESSRRLLITGSSTVAPLAAEIGKLYESENMRFRVDVQTGGSSRGITDVRKGISHIGMISRSVKKSEKDLLSFPIARDGIALLVHQSNPVQELSREQIISIYSGKIKNWSRVGGKDRPITVVSKAEGRSTLELFLKYFELKSSQLKPHVIIGDNEHGVKTIQGNPDAIGYVSVGTVEYYRTRGVPLKALALGGVVASSENVKNGSYPISRVLNLVTVRPPQGRIDSFIQFAKSRKVQKLVQKHYFVPISN